MRRERRKNKTAILTLRVDPELKAAAENAARHDRRSLTNLIEVLLIDHCRTLNFYPKSSTPKEPHS